MSLQESDIPNSEVNEFSEKITACQNSLSEGFQSKNHAKIEEGLFNSQRLFVKFIREHKLDELSSLLRGLSWAWLVCQSDGGDEEKLPDDPNLVYYLGQFRVIINVGVYFLTLEDYYKRKEEDFEVDFWCGSWDDKGNLIARKVL